MNNLEIICLIYKSPSYLNLIIRELQKDYCKVPNWNIGYRIVANDPTKSITSLLPTTEIPYLIYNDPKPNDYYLNRVYRCWNYGAISSTYDNICFVNSDMVFSNNWLANLLKHHNGVNIPCSRLVESGKLLSGKYAISRDFGRNPADIDYDKWYSFAENEKKPMAPYSGLYMPCIFSKKRFIESGMYPEGNIYTNGPGTLCGPVLQSGDDWFFKKLEQIYHMRHITVFDSLCYHIQEGEKDA